MSVKPTIVSVNKSHGTVRGLSAVPQSFTGHGKFGRMFRSLKGQTYAKKDLENLAKILIQRENAKFRGEGEAGKDPQAKVKEGPDVIYRDVTDPNALLDTVYGDPEPADENPTIPAGYTYFGQFIDHDLTFDPNSSLQKQNDPDATDDFRTPRMDLDSLYGRGPDDQPYLYKDRASDGGGIRFLLGRKTGTFDERPGELPRNAEGRALTGDPRNDENGIICQLQVVFLNFHNKVVDTLVHNRPDLNNHEIFEQAQRIVRWHYQYIVLNDYLPLIVGSSTWSKVYVGDGTTSSPNPAIEFYKPNNGQAYMPVEFSVAAFRFGHSMVRPSYALRRDVKVVGGSSTEPFAGDSRFHRIPIFSDRIGTANSLNGFGPLPDNWEIDWRMFFGKLPTQTGTDGIMGVEPQTDKKRTQPSYRIDAQLVDPLAMLPPDVAKSGNMPDGIPSLAYRNLLRGSSFSLPSGQDVARLLNVKPLTETELWSDSKARGFDFTDQKTNPFNLRAPLWYYILREAELTIDNPASDKLGGHHLGPVGGRIVAEVLVGIAINDDKSYLSQQRDWAPSKEINISGFDPKSNLATMAGLILWILADRETF